LIRIIFSIIGGVLLIVFGLLFLIYLPTSGTELATDAIFIGAGILIIRSAYLNRRREKQQAQMSSAASSGKKKTPSKQKQNQGQKKKDYEK
jgi:hypothetical protein